MDQRQVDPSTDNYSAKLAKLIPAEIAAAYLSINSLVGYPEQMDYNVIMALVVLTILCPFYLKKVQKVDNIYQLCFTTAVFPLWALNISIARLTISPVTMGVILILVTVMIPLVPMGPPPDKEN